MLRCFRLLTASSSKHVIQPILTCNISQKSRHPLFSTLYRTVGTMEEHNKDFFQMEIQSVNIKIDRVEGEIQSVEKKLENLEIKTTLTQADEKTLAYLRKEKAYLRKKEADLRKKEADLMAWKIKVADKESDLSKKESNLIPGMNLEGIYILKIIFF